jgi:hypothetical protein
MYELSDKVSRPLDELVLKRLDLAADSPAFTPRTASCSVRNIEQCIALMSRQVSPICAKIRDDFHQRHQLPPPPAGTAWCEKVLTLTRQLQELVAWSSPHCQARVPNFVPPGRYYEPTAKDALLTESAASDTTTASSTSSTTVETSSQSGGKVSPIAAPAMTAALKAKDSVLCEVMRHISNASLASQVPDLEASLQTTLHKLIHQSVAGDCSLSPCGAAALGFNDVIGKMKLDFTALSPPYHMNLYDLSPEEQTQELCKSEMLTEQLRVLESVMETEKVTEVAWKHLKACARDFHTQAQDYVIKMTSKESAAQPYGGSPYEQNRYPAQPYGHYAAQQQPSTPPEVILQVADDAELLKRLGDSVVDKYQAQRSDRTSAAPVLAQIQQKIEDLQEQVERPERERSNFLRKFCKTLDRVLKDHRFLYVRVVTNKVRFTHVNFEQQLSPHMTVSCNVFACNPVPVQMTQLLYDYISLDATGKIRDYFQTIKLFTAAHHIADPAGGFLSTTAWYVMALHVLLRHHLVPNIHMHRLYPSAVGGTTRAAPPRVELSAEQQERLVNIPLLALLDLFFRYYVEHVNIFTSVVTLRDKGTVMPKTKWPGTPVLWRVSVEVRIIVADPVLHHFSISFLIFVYCRTRLSLWAAASPTTSAALCPVPASSR